MKIIGWVLYLISFAMPAVKAWHPSEWFGGPVWGWRCAVLTLAMPWKSFGDNALYAFCMLIAGLTNLFVISYLLTCWRWPQSRWRMLSLLGIGFGLLFSWITLVQQELRPLIGHFVWILGMGIFIASEKEQPK